MRIDVFDALPWALCMIYIIVAPFSKVEESFNTQATHDILYHGLDIEKYDHNEFPGVVPRTFIGAAIVSLIAYPLNFIAKLLISNIITNPVAINGVFLSTKLVSQIIVRMVLGSLVCAGLSKLRHSFSKIFGERAGIAFMLINSSQFHLLFYASRFLPNVFALGLFLFGLAFWMENNTTPAIALFTFATGVFRSELIIFVGPILLEGLFSKRTTFTKTIIVGLVASAVTLAISFGVDSYFWQRPLWPEGAVFWYNTYQNKSSDWGVSPFYWYFTSALPRALLTSLAFIPPGLYFDWQRLKHYVIPTFVFLFLYSFLPHKELRFIFYTIPVFNMVAAVGLARLFTHREKTAYKLGLYIGVLLLIANIAISGFLLLISSLNYPGGYALQKLHIIEENSQTVPYVHIDVASAQTGVSLYGEKLQGWRYSKAEDLNLEDYLQFSHLLSGNSTVALPQFELIGAAEGYDGLQLSKFPDIIKLSNKIFIWKNKQWKAPL